METLAPIRRSLRGQVTRRGHVVPPVALLLVAAAGIGCGSNSRSGGPGGAGGNAGTKGDGSIACSQSTYPAGACCEIPGQDPLTQPYKCDESTGSWVCPPSTHPTPPFVCANGAGGGAGGNGVPGGTGGNGAGGQSGDAATQGTPYACAGGFIVTADGGEVSADDAGSPATCVVGQTYCYLALPHPGTTGEATASCRAFVTGVAPAACATDPTCACFCDLSRGGFHCQTECRCSDTNGFATISCQAI